MLFRWFTEGENSVHASFHRHKQQVERVPLPFTETFSTENSPGYTWSIPICMSHGFCVQHTAIGSSFHFFISNTLYPTWAKPTHYILQVPQSLSKTAAVLSPPYAKKKEESMEASGTTRLQLAILLGQPTTLTFFDLLIHYDVSSKQISPAAEIVFDTDYSVNLTPVYSKEEISMLSGKSITLELHWIKYDESSLLNDFFFLFASKANQLIRVSALERVERTNQMRISTFPPFVPYEKRVSSPKGGGLRWLFRWRRNAVQDGNEKNYILASCIVTSSHLTAPYLFLLRSDLILMFCRIGQNTPTEFQSQVSGLFAPERKTQEGSILCKHLGKKILCVALDEQVSILRLFESTSKAETDWVELIHYITWPNKPCRFLDGCLDWKMLYERQERGDITLLLEVSHFSESEALSPLRLLRDTDTSLFKSENVVKRTAEGLTTDFLRLPRRYAVVRVEANQSRSIISLETIPNDGFHEICLSLFFGKNHLTLQTVSYTTSHATISLHALFQPASVLEFLTTAGPTEAFKMILISNLDTRARGFSKEELAEESSSCHEIPMAGALLKKNKEIRDSHRQPFLCLPFLPPKRLNRFKALKETGLPTLLHIFSSILLAEPKVMCVVSESFEGNLEETLYQIADRNHFVMQNYLPALEFVELEPALELWRTALCSEITMMNRFRKEEPSFEWINHYLLAFISERKAHALLFALALQFLFLLDSAHEEIYHKYATLSFRWLKGCMSLENILLSSPELLAYWRTEEKTCFQYTRRFSTLYTSLLSEDTFSEQLASEILHHASLQTLKKWITVWEGGGGGVFSHFKAVLRTQEEPPDPEAVPLFMNTALQLQDLEEDEQVRSLSLYLPEKVFSELRTHILPLAGKERRSEPNGWPRWGSNAYLQFCLNFLFRKAGISRTLLTPLAIVHDYMNMLRAHLEEFRALYFPHLVMESFVLYTERLIQEHEWFRAHTLLLDPLPWNLFPKIATRDFEKGAVSKKKTLFDTTHEDLFTSLLRVCLTDCDKPRKVFSQFMHHPMLAPLSAGEHRAFSFFEPAVNTLYEYMQTFPPTPSWGKEVRSRYVLSVDLLSEFLLHFGQQGAAGRVFLEAATQFQNWGWLQRAMEMYTKAYTHCPGGRSQTFSSMPFSSVPEERSERRIWGYPSLSPLPPRKKNKIHLKDNMGVGRITLLMEKERPIIRRRFYTLECLGILSPNKPREQEYLHRAHEGECEGQMEIEPERVDESLRREMEVHSEKQEKDFAQHCALQLMDKHHFERAAQLYINYEWDVTEVIKKCVLYCFSGDPDRSWECLTNLLDDLSQSSRHVKEIATWHDYTLHLLLHLLPQLEVPRLLVMNYAALDVTGLLATCVSLCQPLKNRSNPSLVVLMIECYITYRLKLLEKGENASSPTRFYFISPLLEREIRVLCKTAMSKRLVSSRIGKQLSELWAEKGKSLSNMAELKGRESFASSSNPVGG